MQPAFVLLLLKVRSPLNSFKATFYMSSFGCMLKKAGHVAHIDHQTKRAMLIPYNTLLSSSSDMPITRISGPSISPNLFTPIISPLKVSHSDITLYAVPCILPTFFYVFLRVILDCLVFFKTSRTCNRNCVARN